MSPVVSSEDGKTSQAEIPVKLYPTKQKLNGNIFPLSFPFNAKMLIVIKYLVLIKSSQNSSVA